MAISVCIFLLSFSPILIFYSSSSSSSYYYYHHHHHHHHHHHRRRYYSYFLLFSISQIYFYFIPVQLLQNTIVGCATSSTFGIKWTKLEYKW